MKSERWVSMINSFKEMKGLHYVKTFRIEILFHFLILPLIHRLLLSFAFSFSIVWAGHRPSSQFLDKKVQQLLPGAVAPSSLHEYPYRQMALHPILRPIISLHVLPALH